MVLNIDGTFRCGHADRERGTAMTHVLAKGVMAIFVLCATAVMPLPATAGDWPMTLGDFWEVSTVQVKDGGDLTYANFIAGEWKASRDFAKSKGWIKDYMVLRNAYARKGEPDLYLITITDRLASGPEAEKRNDEFTAWRKKSNAQLVKESGDRAQIREIGSDILLQEMKFK
jgi:hypothetical protein